nr:uncharacterized protein LOC105495647 [Macaca nemestrina]
MTFKKGGDATQNCATTEKCRLAPGLGEALESFLEEAASSHATCLERREGKLGPLWRLPERKQLGALAPCLRWRLLPTLAQAGCSGWAAWAESGDSTARRLPRHLPCEPAPYCGRIWGDPASSFGQGLPPESPAARAGAPTGTGCQISRPQARGGRASTVLNNPHLTAGSRWEPNACNRVSSSPAGFGPLDLPVGPLLYFFALWARASFLCQAFQRPLTGIWLNRMHFASEFPLHSKDPRAHKLLFTGNYLCKLHPRLRHAPQGSLSGLDHLALPAPLSLA